MAFLQEICFFHKSNQMIKKYFNLKEFEQEMKMNDSGENECMEFVGKQSDI